MKFAVQAADGVRLYGDTAGAVDKPALLFLNSIGCDRSLWRAQVEALAGAFLCIVFDARGHGGSDAPAADYAVEDLGRDGLAVLDGLGLASAHVCGLSLGGLTAQWLGAHAPERVLSLTLANTASRIGVPNGWEERRRRVLQLGLEAIADMAIERFFSVAFRDAHPNSVAEARARLLATSRQGYAGCCAALRDADLTPDLPRIAVPVLVIGGEQDVSTPPDQARALAAGARRARLELLPAGHLSNLEQPEAFTATLRAHLEAL